MGPRRIASALSFMALGLLTACDGDLGPLALPMQSGPAFQIQSGRQSLSMKSQESDTMSFFYDKSRGTLSVSLGSKRVAFRNTAFNINAGNMIASPANSGVKDNKGLRVGVQVSRRYLGGNNDVTFWDYRAQVFNERNARLATGTARIEEHHRL